MKTTKQKDREEYEYSPLFQFIQEVFFRNDEKYKKIDFEIISDLTLTTVDLATYMAIVKLSSFEDFYQSITHKAIYDITGILQPNQSKSIKKLVEKGYIEVLPTEYENKYKVEVNPKRYLKLRLSQFNGLKGDKKKYVRKLRGLILSNCSDYIVSYPVAKKKFGEKLTREEYKKIKDTYSNVVNHDEEVAIQNYVTLEYT